MLAFKEDIGGVWNIMMLISESRDVLYVNNGKVSSDFRLPGGETFLCVA